MMNTREGMGTRVENKGYGKKERGMTFIENRVSMVINEEANRSYASLTVSRTELLTSPGLNALNKSCLFAITNKGT